MCDSDPPRGVEREGSISQRASMPARRPRSRHPRRQCPMVACADHTAAPRARQGMVDIAGRSEESRRGEVYRGSRDFSRSRTRFDMTQRKRRAAAAIDARAGTPAPPSEGKRSGILRDAQNDRMGIAIRVLRCAQNDREPSEKLSSRVLPAIGADAYDGAVIRHGKPEKPLHYMRAHNSYPRSRHSMGKATQ
jgi:hypothetical protein